MSTLPGSGDGEDGEDERRSQNRDRNNSESTEPERRVTRSSTRSSAEANLTGQPAPEENETVRERPVRLSAAPRHSGRIYRFRNADSNDSDDSGEDIPRSILNLEHELETSSSDSSLSNGSIENDSRLREIDENTPTPKVLLKPKPKHKWFVINEVVNRQKGTRSRFLGSELFQQRYYGSLHAVQRLELMYKLEEHVGCVNNLNFNQSGTMLTSASDDKKIAVWDWACGKCLLSYNSGHSSNVFQAKFLPLPGDCYIVSCARDGQVRLAELSNTGVCKNTRLLAQHKRPTHKLATHPGTPHVFLSAGEDGLVLSHDVRLNKSNKMLFVKEGTHRIGLYSIHNNPVNCDEFCVTGEDQFIRLYDRRKISQGLALKKFCPQHLINTDIFLHITCAVFNYNGTEILGSFNDDDIYLFDTRHSQNSDYVHKYEGHRNSVTVKAVNFFGPRSEFIVSGSDCGNIYFWDKHNESIVQWMRGDDDGVVNCLEPHPQIPVIATSGLDSDIKIWVPSCEEEPAMNGLKRTVVSNQQNRLENHGRRSDPFGGQMRWLWRQIQRYERRNGMNMSPLSPFEDIILPTDDGVEEAVTSEIVSSSSSDEEEEEENTDPCQPRCTPS